MAALEHHAKRQSRDQGAFRSDVADDQLYQLLREVVRSLRPTRAEKLTQKRFDELAPAVAKQEQLALRTAVAIYLRLGKPYGKQWIALVREVMEAVAGERDLVKTLASAKAGPPDWYLDERYVYYAMQRVQAENDGQPFAPGRYDRLADELRKTDAKLNRGAVLDQVLPTSSQIITICGTWEIACRLVGLTAPAKTVAKAGHSPIKVLEHFYETRGGWPGKKELIEYANNELAISIPTERAWNLTSLKGELVALRGQLGYPTPDDGPHPRLRRSPQELAALLDGAQRRNRPSGYWKLDDNVLRALADYASLFEGRADLRQKHYLAHRAEHGWPNLDAISRLGEFQAVLDRARKWRDAQAATAA